MGEHAWAVKLADRLIRKHGKPLSFYRETPDDSGGDTPWKPDGIYPDVPLRTTIVGVTVQYDEKKIDGTLIRRGDVNCIVAAEGLSYVPTTGDYCEFSGQKYKLVDVSVVEPGVDRILYDIQLRG